MRENAGLCDRPGRVNEASLLVTNALALHIVTQGIEDIADCRVVLVEPRRDGPFSRDSKPVSAASPMCRPLPPFKSHGREILA